MFSAEIAIATTGTAALLICLYVAQLALAEVAQFVCSLITGKALL